MASAATLVGTTVFGNMVVKHGTIKGSGTSGTITTGLSKIFWYGIQSTSAATAFYGSVSGGTISYTMAEAETGIWMAIGLD